MKPFPARSFVQVHYHNRPGGVNKVIGYYAEAHAEAHAHICSKASLQSSFSNLIICKNDLKNGFSFPAGGIRNIPECSYRSFPTKDAFLKTREILVRKLMAIIRSDGVLKPLCVIGHNLTLGKNCALSSAFAHCATLCEHLKDDVRFFSIIHDFAEEGRIDCLKQIYGLQDLGIDIWNDLYPKTNNLHFVTPNMRNYTLLKRARFNVDLLANPVETEKVNRRGIVQEKRIVVKKLISYSKREHTPFDPALPTLFYPARVISRKNIIEALLVSNIICKVNLLVGKCGPSATHWALYSKIRKLCVKYSLPVVFDCSAAFTRRASEIGFPSILYAGADACISTSIAEGFGYAFYESWTNNKYVIGRKPVDFSPIPGMKFPGLYARMPIPVSWIPIDDCVRKYFDRMRQYYHVGKVKQFSSFSKFKTEFKAALIKNDAIDFGCLDEATQLNVANRLMGSKSMAMEWERLCGKELKKIQDAVKIGLLPKRSLIRFNQDTIKKKVSGEKFVKNFAQCFFKPRIKSVPQNRYKEIARYFGDLSRFRLLMTPESPHPMVHAQFTRANEHQA
jgi:hypothetical protein